MNVTLYGGPLDGAVVRPAKWRTDTLILRVWNHSHRGHSLYMIENPGADDLVASYMGKPNGQTVFIKCGYRPKADNCTYAPECY